MIAALRGRIFEKTDGKILLDVNGIIYEINVSMITFSSAENEEIFYITEIIKENEYTLYGFTDKNEKTMFESLIKLNGVGPKVALAVCSTYTPQTFMDIISKQDVGALKKVPGIGPKGAKRILMEMGEFDLIQSSSPAVNQALNALEGLGFNKTDILEALNGLEGSVEEIIKAALKRLSK